MRHRFLFFCTLVCLLFGPNKSIAQKTPSRLPLTADSLATGNYKDVFKSFFQVAFDRFTSDHKEVQFTSNPYAVMAKMDPDLLIDDYYVRYRNLRNLNFSFGARLDSAYKFNGFSSGIKYALVNKRDETVSRAFVIDAFNANNEFNNLNSALEQHISTLPAGSAQRNLFRDEKSKMFRGEKTFDKLEPSYQALVVHKAKEVGATNFIKLLQENEKLNIQKTSQQSYDSLRTLFQNRLLWTLSVSDTTYQDRFLFSNVNIATEVLKGITDPLKPVGLELNLRGIIHSIDDTARTGRDLQRNVLRIEPGVNIFFKAKKSQYSFAELKISSAFSRVLRGLYTGEATNAFTLNGTIRIRVLNDIWIPLEFNWDPDTGNVFGFLNVRANFHTLGKVLNTATK